MILNDQGGKHISTLKFIAVLFWKFLLHVLQHIYLVVRADREAGG